MLQCGSRCYRDHVKTIMFLLIPNKTCVDAKSRIGMDNFSLYFIDSNKTSLINRERSKYLNVTHSPVMELRKFPRFSPAFSSPWVSNAFASSTLPGKNCKIFEISIWLYCIDQGKSYLHFFRGKQTSNKTKSFKEEIMSKGHIRQHSSEAIFQKFLSGCIFLQISYKRAIFSKAWTLFSQPWKILPVKTSGWTAALGLRLRAAFSRPRSQLFPIWTPQPANNRYLFKLRQTFLSYPSIILDTKNMSILFLWLSRILWTCL